MKIARYKKVQRFLNFYNNNFGFHKPYQVLVDGTFCFSAKQEQINIKEQIPKYLVAEVKLLTTRCVVIETEKIAKKALGALTILKQFGIHQCHHKEAVGAAECLLSMIGKKNDSHYFVATQDRSLQDALRVIPGVPLVYLHLKAPTLEKPSDVSCKLAHSKSENTFAVNAVQRDTLKTLKEQSGIESETLKMKKKRKKGGPNPLSCLKRKKNNSSQKPNKLSEGKIKKRKRVKLPTHIKDIIKTVS